MRHKKCIIRESDVIFRSMVDCLRRDRILSFISINTLWGKQTNKRVKFKVYSELQASQRRMRGAGGPYKYRGRVQTAGRAWPVHRPWIDEK